VLVALLGSWLLAPLPLSVFLAFPTFLHREFGTVSSAPCPTPVLQGRFSIPPPTSAVGVRIKFAFYVFQFCCRNSVCPGAALDYVPREWVWESHVVLDDHLFVLQIYASSFGISQQGEMALLFSVWHQIGRLSTG
jgi:hypothetical protein